MKTSEEIRTMLVFELSKRINRIKSSDQKKDYYNDILGDTSFLLAGLLDSLLRQNFDWDSKCWIDDSLIESVQIKADLLLIKGVMIWGKEDTTEQWTDPFYFEIVLVSGDPGFKKLTFLFSDIDIPAISYEDFKWNRNYWNTTDRNWKYIINY